MFVVRTTFTLDPAYEDRAEESITTLAAHAREEDGTVAYDATRDLLDPATVHFFELYADRAAAERHTDSDPYRAFVRALPELADGDLETRQFETDDGDRYTFSPDEAVASLDSED